MPYSLPFTIDSDEYYTPGEIWDKISHLLPKNKIYYEGFYGMGHTVKWLQKNNFQVICDPNGDFFSCHKLLKLCDFVISNPPFSKKFEILEYLKKNKKAFVLILPNSTIFTVRFREIFKDDLENISYAFSSSRFAYIKKDKLQPNASFHSCFVFYKMGLEKQVYYI